MRARITLERDRAAYLPGGRVQGVVGWHVERAPKVIELRLFWRVEGRGSRDVAVVARQRLSELLPEERRSFAFDLPEMPYTYYGVNFSIVWTIEAVVPEPLIDRLIERVATVDIIVSPTLQAITPPPR